MHIKRSTTIIAALATLTGGIAISASLAQPQPDSQSDRQNDPQRTQQSTAQSRETRIGTVDLYLIAERVMQQDDYRRAREQGQAQFEQQLERINTEIEQLTTRLQRMQQNDPQAQETIARYQTLEEESARLQQQRQQELERINSQQLIDSFNQTRAAAQRIANREGYTHILANRQFDRNIETETVGATLQEMLARPVLVGIPEDDITRQVLEALNLPITAPANATPANQGNQNQGSNTGIPR